MEISAAKASSAYDDHDIIRRVQSGDTEAFSAIVHKYHRQLLNFIYRLVADGHVVEDIGQEVFLSAYRSLRNFDLDGGTPFSAWLFIIARNRCISELRKKRPAGVPIEDAEGISTEERTPEQAAMDNEWLRSVRACLEQLEEPFKSTLLESVRGASLSEIALREGVPTGTIKSRMARGRKKMKAALREFFGGKP